MRYEYLSVEDIYNNSLITDTFTAANELSSDTRRLYAYVKTKDDVVKLMRLTTVGMHDDILFLGFDVSCSKSGIALLELNLNTKTISENSDTVISMFLAVSEEGDYCTFETFIKGGGFINPDPSADTVADFGREGHLWISEMGPEDCVKMQRVSIKDTLTQEVQIWYRLFRDDEVQVPMEKVLDTFRNTFPSSMVVTKAEVISYAIAETTLYTQSYPEGA